MSARAVLRRGRARHSALLDDLGDRGRVERVTGSTYDASELTDTPIVAVLWRGPCRVKSPTTAPGQALAGDASIVLRRYDVQFDWDTEATLAGEPTAFVVGDTLVLEASSDPWLIGRPLTVIAVGLSGSTTARHVVVEDSTSPGRPPEDVTP